MSRSAETSTPVLNCEVCLNEIPPTVGDNAEADEYVSNFCGLACYQQWRDQQKEANAEQPLSANDET